MGCSQKKLQASMAMPAAPVLVPSQNPVAPSVTTVTSAVNGKGDNEIMLNMSNVASDLAVHL